MKKKGAAIAFNTIIVAAIALVVLAIVMFLLISRSNLFQKGIADCVVRSGNCTSGACPDAKPIPAFKGCYVGDKYEKSFNCCIGEG